MTKMTTILSDKEIFQAAVDECESISQMTEWYGFRKSGASFNQIKKYAAIHNIELPVYSNNGKARPIIPNEKIFVKNSRYSAVSAIKIRLVRDLNWNYKCYMDDCPSPKPIWRGIKLTLQLDHINGIRNDNRLENLRFLCPNCHTQTETHSGKNNSSRILNPELYICECGKTKGKNSKNCRDCSNKILTKSRKNKTKIIWPSTDWILEQLKTKGYVELGKELGVTDNTIRKHLKSQGIHPPKKSRGPVPGTGVKPASEGM